MFLNRYESHTKQEEVFDELAVLRIDDFLKDTNIDKDVLSEVVHRVSNLTTFDLPSDRSEAMQKRFLK